MSYPNDLNVLEQQVAQAEAVRSASRAAGDRARYLTACSTLDALTRKLEALTREKRFMTRRLPSPRTDC